MTNSNGNSIPTRLRAQLTGKLDKHLLAYVTAATAAGVGLIAAQPVTAEVVYTPVNKQLGPGTYFLDLNHDGINDFKFVLAHHSQCLGVCTTSPGHHHHTAFNSQNGELQVYGLGSNQVFGEASASALPVGVAVGPNGKFPGGNKMVGAFDINSSLNELDISGPWKTASFASNTIKNHFVGFRFLIQGSVHFGWARFTVNSRKGANITATLTGYAYQSNSDTPIETLSPVVAENRSVPPEMIPGLNSFPSLGVLARGVDGLEVWRKQIPPTFA